MACEVEVSEQAGLDLADIFQFLHDSFRALGDDDETAFDRAESRIRGIADAMLGLGAVPHQGTRRPDLGEGFRNVTKGRAIFYFELRDDRRTLVVLAAFFGGQDHLAVMLDRLTGATPSSGE